MSGALSLTVTTPLAVEVDERDVVSVRAEDASGGVGVLPGHADLLTVLGNSVLRWRPAGGAWRYCAVRHGVLRVIDGDRVEVACREAARGDDLAALEAFVRSRAADATDAARRARGEQIRLHASVIRRLTRRFGAAVASDDLAGDFR